MKQNKMKKKEENTVQVFYFSFLLSLHQTVIFQDDLNFCLNANHWNKKISHMLCSHMKCDQLFIPDS